MKNKSIRHWLIVLACCLNCMTSTGLLGNTIGIFYTPVAGSLGVGRGNVALFSTIVGICTGVVTPLVARFLSKKNLHKMMASGIVMASLGFAVLSAAKDVRLFYIVAPFVGVGQAMYGGLPLTIIIGNWFKEKHGLAMGISFSFTGIGGAVFNPIVTHIITNYGWSAGFKVFSALILILALPTTLFIMRFSPEEKGLLPYGGTEPAFSGSASDKSAPAEKPKAMSIILSLPFLLVCLFGMCNNMLPSTSSHISGYALSRGFSAETAALTVSAVMIGNIFFKLFIGFLSDKIGAIGAASLMLCSSISALAVLAFVPLSSFFATAVTVFFFGACFSVGAVGIPLVIHRTFGHELYAQVYSYLSFIAAFTSAMMTSAAGFIYDSTGSYKAAFIICMCSASIALVLLNIIGKMKRRA